MARSASILLLLALYVAVGSCDMVRLHSLDIAERYPMHKEIKLDPAAARRLSTVKVPFVVGMYHKEGSLEKLEKLWHAVSNPKSPQYGQYLTEDEIMELTGAPADRVQRVKQWLIDSGVAEADITRKSNSFHCVAMPRVVERAFQTSMVPLQSLMDGRSHWSYSGHLHIPSSLAKDVEIVTGLSPPTHHRSKARSATPRGRDHATTFLSRLAERAFSVLQGQVPAKPYVETYPFDYGQREAVASSQSRVGSTVFPSKGAMNAVNGKCPSTSHPTTCLNSNAEAYACCGPIATCCPSLLLTAGMPTNVTGAACCEYGTKCCRGQCMQECPPDPSDVLVSPGVLRDMYRIPPGAAANKKVQTSTFSQSVVAFGDQYTDGAKDLFNAGFNERPFTVTQANVPAPACLMDSEPCDQVESDLDIQYMSSMGSGVNQWFWENTGNVYVKEWAETVLAHPSPKPMVHSISYIDDERMEGPQYGQVANVELQKLGVMGMTIMACSGDTGSPGWSTNLPIPGTGRNFPRACANCPTTKNLCTQLTVVKKAGAVTHTCHLPSGLQSREPGKVYPCVQVLNDTSCLEALVKMNSTASSCGYQVHMDDKPNPIASNSSSPIRLPRIFSEKCTCKDIPTVTSTDGSCTVKGFEFDPTLEPILFPLYPASSPYVTAVGATQLTSYHNPLCAQSPVAGPSSIPSLQCPLGDITSSIATRSLITSGGGFSSLFPRPSYQQNAITSYLAKPMALPPSKFYDSSKRAYPDVAIAGHHYLVARTLNSSSTECPCDFLPVDGTSCSSPAFAGIVSLINSKLLAQGRPLLGPLNHLLYQMAEEAPETFYDVRQGDNKCTEMICSEYGFEATEGYDLTSGLGAPNVEQILNYLQLTPQYANGGNSSPSNSSGDNSGKTAKSIAIVALVVAGVLLVAVVILGRRGRFGGMTVNSQHADTSRLVSDTPEPDYSHM